MTPNSRSCHATCCGEGLMSLKFCETPRRAGENSRQITAARHTTGVHGTRDAAICAPDRSLLYEYPCPGGEVRRQTKVLSFPSDPLEENPGTRHLTRKEPPTHIAQEVILVAPQGFEPRLIGSEPTVLPLN